MKAVLLTLLSCTLMSGAAAAATNDAVPNFDVSQSCRAAAKAANTPERMQGCLDTEKKAREQLVQQWDKFKPAARELCLRSASAGGEPTYTELITCLEMERDNALKPVNATAPEVPAMERSGVGPKTAIERAKGH